MDDQKPWWQPNEVHTPFGVVTMPLVRGAARVMAPQIPDTLGAPVDALSWVLRQHPLLAPDDPANPYGNKYFWSSPAEQARTRAQYESRWNGPPTPTDHLPKPQPPVMGSEWWRNTLGSMFGSLSPMGVTIDRSGRAPGTSPTE